MMEPTATQEKELEVQEGQRRFDLDDKDLAMAGIVILAICGGVLLALVVKDGTVVGSLFTGAITALGSLATGRKKSQ